MGVNRYKFQKELFFVTEYKDSCPVDYHPTRSIGSKPKPKWFGATKKIVSSEDELKVYYGDITKEIEINRATLVLEEKDNSISIKFYDFLRGRNVGKQYFFVRKSMHYVTYNFKYKNFYSGHHLSKHKKPIAKTIGTNKWDSIINQLSHIPTGINSLILTDTPDKPFSLDVYNTNYGWNMLSSVLNMFFDIIHKKENIKIDGYESIREVRDLNGMQERFFLTYMTANGFGVPDAWRKFMRTSTSKKILKKSGSLVESFMKHHKFKGRLIRELLNTKENVDFYKMNYMYHLLGVDYFNKISPEFLLNYDDKYRSIMSNFSLESINLLNGFLNNTEKRNITKLLGDGWNNMSGAMGLSLLTDHIGFKRKLMEYGEKVTIKSYNKLMFDEEHYEWSELLHSYRNGKVKRFYEGTMKKELQEPIYGPHIDYYPVLLTTSEDYNKESQHQHNCVRTYVEESNCFIISLRENSTNGSERATIEFRYRKGKSPENVQSLGKYNNALSPNWNFVLEELQNRVNRLWEKNVIVTPSMTKEFPNGKKLTRNAIWKDYGKERNSYYKGWRMEWDNTEEYRLSNSDFDLDFF